MDDDKIEKGASGSMKGKEKESNNSTAPSAEDGRPGLQESSSTSDNLLSRLATSTTKLTGNLMSGQLDTRNINDALPSSKAGSSNTVPGAGASADEASTRRAQPAPISHGNKFKSPHAQENEVLAETQFSAFLEGTGVSEQTRSPQMETTNYIHGSWQDGIPKETSHHAAYPMTDGMDVVNLLNSGYDEVMTQEADPEPSMTAEERAALQRALFGQRMTGRPGQWHEALNFFPDFLSDDVGRWGYAEISRHLGVDDPDEARGIWIDQWEGVLSSYTDEVWGDLGSLVGEAREELQTLADAQEEASPSQLKAVRRLQQILGQIRGF